MKNKNSITAVIIAKNEELVLETCLETVAWCNNLLVIDTGSTDKTVQIAEQFNAKVVSFSHTSFSKMRNEALKYVKTDWVFYIDADERVTKSLAKEIYTEISSQKYSALSMKRKNICYGTEFLHGGWENDVVTRIFLLSSFLKWTGSIHESPNFNGESIELQNKLIHHTHRNTKDGLEKTIQWTGMEAKLLADSDIGKVGFFTLIRKGSMEFIRRAFFEKGYKDGLPGMIEALVQGINRVLVYIQVWELQQGIPLEEQYRRRDKKIIAEWNNRT